jgi:hypothetical protein
VQYFYVVARKKFFFGNVTALKGFFSLQPRLTHMVCLPEDLLPLFVFCENNVPSPQSHLFSLDDIQTLFLRSFEEGVSARCTSLGMRAQARWSDRDSRLQRYVHLPSIRRFFDQLLQEAWTGEGLLMQTADVRRIAKQGFARGWQSFDADAN